MARDYLSFSDNLNLTAGLLTVLAISRKAFLGILKTVVNELVAIPHLFSNVSIQIIKSG